MIAFALFMNTGIILLAANANLSEQTVDSKGNFNGAYYDYMPKWYYSVA